VGQSAELVLQRDGKEMRLKIAPMRGL